MDDKLLQEEAQRSIKYEQLKSGVKADVNAEVAERAAIQNDQSGSLSTVANDFRGKAINEIVETDREVERARGLARVSQFVDYGFYVIYALLGLRLLLALFAARQSNDFVQFLKAISDPFYAPFRGIVPSLSTEEGFTLALPIIVAIVVWALLHLGVNGLLRIFAHRKTEI
ncbi:MAG TPA: YggT family protein [Terriglobales bacterium]|nr:YggT family protein [Terriglobales bacterium]